MQCHAHPWGAGQPRVASSPEPLSATALWDGTQVPPGPLKGKPAKMPPSKSSCFQSHLCMVAVLFCEAHTVATGAPALLAHVHKWEGAGMNQAVAAVVCEQVFLMYLSLVSVKVIKVNNPAITQCPRGRRIAPWITLADADLW